MVTKSIFGTDKNGNTVTAYRIENGALTAEILDRGATIHSLIFEGVDVALGYDSVAGYEENDGYLGATIGRYGNRIAAGKFTLNGKEYTLDRNNGENHLHGGNVGYDSLIWSEGSVEDNAVTLTLTDHGEETGYPGTLTVSVRFSVNEDALLIEYSAVGDEDTPVNLTNHCYFNLGGAGNGDVLDTRLQVYASHYLPVDEGLIPTGVLRKTVGTPFDFITAAKAIGKDIGEKDKQLSLGGGYDHNFCLDGEGFRLALQAYSPKTGIIMSCLTDEPGVQLYTGNVLSTIVGKGTETGYGKHYGFCAETQHYPDSPNQPAFPTTTLKAGERYESKTAYAFSKE